MSQHDPRGAARDRDLGLRRIGKLTWRAGLAGLGSSLVLGVVLGHHASASTQAPEKGHDSGAVVIPAQPPVPATGRGQVISGAS